MRPFIGSFAFAALAAIVVVWLPGCSQGPPVGKVHGKVTLDGQPLKGATVTFLPDSGRPSFARTDGNGEYTIQYTGERSGALVGSHMVRISTLSEAPPSDSGPRAAENDRVPAKYNTNSELRADVKKGNNELNFDLTSF